MISSGKPVSASGPSAGPCAAVGADGEDGEDGAVGGVGGTTAGEAVILTATQPLPGGVQLTPGGPLGLATGINFQPTGGGKAAITGDFVLIGDEVNPVIRALRENGIEVTALHSHMLDEQPRLYFMHFWANDDAVKLAKGLRAALDKTASTKS